MNELNGLDSPGISIVIVTYNGSSRIVPTLKHIVNQKNVYFNWELIVVDNNSTDDTIKIVKSYWENEKVQVPLIIKQEQRQGTMYARENGIKSSSYRYILFCDDDNWLNSDYLKIAYETITKSSECAALGGKGEISYPRDMIVPAWIKPFENNYGAGAQGQENKFSSCLYTAGLIVDRKWLNLLYKAGFVSSLKGRDDKSLVAGEDTELTYALKSIGGKLIYSPKLQFYHYMPPRRLDWSYLQQLYQAFGFAEFILLPYKESSSKVIYNKLFKREIRNIKRIIELSLKYLFIKSKPGMKEVLEKQKRIGELKAFFKAFNLYRFNKIQVRKLRSNIANPKLL